MNRVQAALRIYELLGEPSDVENFDDDDVVYKKLDDISKEVCKGEVKNLLDPGQVFRATQLEFLKGSPKFYDLVQPVTLTADVAAGATSLSFDATNFADSGYLWIEGDLIKYDTNNNTSGVADVPVTEAGVSIAHSNGAKVYQLYDLPSNINKPYSLFYMKQRSNATIPIPFEDEREGTGAYNRYASIIRDVVNSTNLLFIHGFSGTSNRAVMYYYNLYTTLNDDETDSVIPDEYMRNCICPLVAGEILLENEDGQQATEKLNMGYAKLDQMYTYLAKPVFRNKQKVRVNHRRSFSGLSGSYGKRGAARNFR